tara:strand:- start:16746 stop:16958 length:213 start_codon:yes stop_codon:yes gene_type:complete
MYRIDKFLNYYHNSLKSCQCEIEKGVWVNARPLPFYYGVFTKGYWREWLQRRRDAKAVRQGKAIAVTWES